MRCGQVVRRELPSVVLHHHRSYTRDCVVQGCRFSSVVAGEHDQHNRLLPDPHYSGIVGDKRLAVSGFVRDADISQVAWEAIVHLLHFHDVEQLLARHF